MIFLMIPVDCYQSHQIVPQADRTKYHQCRNKQILARVVCHRRQIPTRKSTQVLNYCHYQSSSSREEAICSVNHQIILIFLLMPQCPTTCTIVVHYSGHLARMRASFPLFPPLRTLTKNLVIAIIVIIITLIIITRHNYWVIINSNNYYFKRISNPCMC